MIGPGGSQPGGRWFSKAERPKLRRLAKQCWERATSSADSIAGLHLEENNDIDGLLAVVQESLEDSDQWQSHEWLRSLFTPRGPVM